MDTATVMVMAMDMVIEKAATFMAAKNSARQESVDPSGTNSTNNIKVQKRRQTLEALKSNSISNAKAIKVPEKNETFISILK